MARTLLILCAAAAAAVSVTAVLGAKERAWQTGQLLDKARNPYFRTVANDAAGVSSSNSSSFGSSDNGALAVTAHASEGDLTYDNYVIAGGDTVYLVEFAHFKTFPVANLSVAKPLSFAIEKNKLIIRDLDHREFETSILKQTSKQGTALASADAPASPASASVQKPVAPAQKAEAKASPEKAKTEPAKADKLKPAQEAKVQEAKVQEAKPKPQSSKPDNVFATAALSNKDAAPPQPPKPQEQKTAPAKPPAKPVVVASAVKPPAPKPDPVPQAKPVTPKPAPKAEAAVTKPASRAEVRPEGPIVRATTKDRAWQSGHLLSVPSNNYFFNVTYSSDVEGSSWPFSQGSDGRFTVTGQIANNTDSAYTYDNYVLESEFVAYLVQRMRPKTSPTVRLPGTKPLKFAVEKNKLWVLDENGIEYETKVIKLVQKDSIADPLTRSAAR